MRKGINPNQGDKVEATIDQSGGLTLGQGLGDYIEGDDDLKATTAKQYRRTIVKHLNEWLDRPLAELVNLRTLVSLQKDITKRAGPIAANNTMRTLRAITIAARESAPAGGRPIPYWPIESKQLRKQFWNKENTRINWLEPAQLKAWWAATEQLVDEFPVNGGLARNYLQFVLLTGLRRREASGLLWENVSILNRAFRVTDSKRPTGCDIPLSDYLVGILLRSSLCEGRVFNLDEPKKFVKWVRIQSGVDFTVHDLRRSFIVYAEKQEFGAHTLAALTNRSAPGKSANTNFASHHILMDTEKLEKPMQRITNYILGHADVSSNSASHNSTSHNSAGHNSAGQASVTTLQHKELAGPGIRFELSWKPKNQLPIPQGYLSPIFQG